MRSKWNSMMPIASALAVALIYFGAGKLGLALAFQVEQVTAVWPPTGIALAAVLLFGYRIWPGIALGAFLANVTTPGETLFTALGITLGNTLEAVAGAWLLHQLDFRNSLERLRDVLSLLCLAALDKAEPHARKACELAPGNADNWEELLMVLAGRELWSEMRPVCKDYLRHHPTPHTYYFLALAAEKMHDQKEFQHYIAEGLKLNPNALDLLLTQIAGDLKFDKTPVAYQQARQRLIAFRKLMLKDAKASEVVNQGDVVFISIIVHALNDETSQAQALLDTALHEDSKNEEFLKLRQILGVTGLQPPSLLKP
jgi:hypothetical protein